MSADPAGAEAAGPPELAVLVGWIGEQMAGPSEDAEEAQAAAAELAGLLAGLAPDDRAAFWREKWPPEGLARVLDRMEAAPLATAAAGIAAASAADPAWLHALADAALRQDAAEAAEAGAMLRPGGAASLLMLACQTSGPGAAYLTALGAAAGPEDGPAALEKLAAALAATVLPACISRPASVLADAAGARFGIAAAQALVRAALAVRLLAPALAAAGLSQAAGLLGRIAGGTPGLPAVAAALDEFAGQAVAAGRQARRLVAEGDDPDDLLVQRGAALSSALDLLATFEEPTPPDPLGTLPAIRLTRLGQAILAVRRQRPMNYDWGAVQAAQEEDPDGFSDLLADERAAVLDLVLEAEGVAPEPIA